MDNQILVVAEALMVASYNQVEADLVLLLLDIDTINHRNKNGK